MVKSSTSGSIQKSNAKIKPSLGQNVQLMHYVKILIGFENSDALLAIGNSKNQELKYLSMQSNSCYFIFFSKNTN